MTDVYSIMANPLQLRVSGSLSQRPTSSFNLFKRENAFHLTEESVFVGKYGLQ